MLLDQNGAVSLLEVNRNPDLQVSRESVRLCLCFKLCVKLVSTRMSF